MITLNLPTGVDVSSDLQAALNANAGSKIVLPAGNYLASGLELSEFTTLIGEGKYSTVITGLVHGTDVMTVAGDYVEIRDLGIQGRKGNSGTNALTIAQGFSGARISNCLLQYGMSALVTRGSDCVFEDLTVNDSYGIACVISDNGTGWWHRIKCDTAAADGGGVPQYGFYHAGDGSLDPCENYFNMIDLSGEYPAGSLYCSDSGPPVSIMTFVNSVLARGIAVGMARSVEFIGCKRSGTWPIPAANISIIGGLYF